MANTHWITNKGKEDLAKNGVQGATDLWGHLLWADSGTIPAAIDTEAEIQDVDDMATFLAMTGVIQVTGGSYAAQNLASVAAVVDDTNNRANIDAANLTFSAVAASGTKQVYGMAIARGDGDGGSDNIFWSLAIFSATVTPNGSDITVTISDFARAS